MAGSFSYWTLVNTGHIIIIKPTATAIINTLDNKFTNNYHGNCARIDTPLNLAVFNAFRTLGANSPITTPTTIVINTSGVSSRSSMLSSLNGLDFAATSPQLDSE